MPTANRLNALKQEFGKRLRRARFVAGYDSASDFARELGIGAQRYNKNERGESIPHLDVLEDIVRLTNCSLDWLLLGKTERQRINTK